MPNEKNLIPLNKRAKSEQREIAKKGGAASGKKRREKKTVRQYLSALLETTCKDKPQFNEIAKNLGIESNITIKELLTVVAMLNTTQKATLDDLEKLSVLIGENQTEADNGMLGELFSDFKRVK